jgi:hypothetical protein
MDISGKKCIFLLLCMCPSMDSLPVNQQNQHTYKPETHKPDTNKPVNKADCVSAYAGF